tara:strand:+ start:852 stop:1151 length:300 start_codon:yes stop_codon:yes gene_type:complete
MDYDPLALSVVDQKNQIGLTNKQHDEVIEQYIDIVIDRMELDDLVQYVREDLDNRYSYMNSIEFKEYVEDMEEDDLFDELVDNVTNETVLDINNTGGAY